MFDVFSDWNFEPVNLLPENDLPTTDVVHWFSTSLPGHHLGLPRPLVHTLGQLVNQKEATLRQQVHTLVVSPLEILKTPRDNWLSRQKMSIDKYARTTLSPNKQVDGFFMLGVACKFAVHLPLIHLDSIWTTHSDSAFKDGDLMLAQITDGFREVLKIKDDVQIFDTLGDTSCLDTVWTNQPPRFVAPVADPVEHAQDAGYTI